MIASLMLYGVAVSALAWLVAFFLERGVAVAGGARRFVWIAALAASLAIPGLRVWLDTSTSSSTVPTWHIAAQSDGTSPHVIGVSGSREASIRPGTTLQASDNSPVDSALRVEWPSAPALDRFLAAIWWASSAAFIGALAFTWIRLARIARTLPTRYVEGTPVLVSGNLGPAVIGFLDPRIVLPRWLLDSPKGRRAMVVAHEREHIEARDQLLLLAGLLCAAAAPWNPLLWWQLRRLRFAIEVDCDTRVLRQGTDPRRYGEMLLAMSKCHARTSLAAVALTEPTSHLERRIQIMMQQAPRYTRLAIAAFLATAAACVAAAAGLNAPASVQKEPLQLKPGQSDPPDFRKLIAAVHSRHPEVERDPLTHSVLITAFLNEDGSLRVSGKEQFDKAAFEPGETLEQRLSKRGLLTPTNGNLVTLIRTRTEGEYVVDVLATLPPLDRNALDAKVAAAVGQRYPDLHPDKTHLITVAMSADGTIRSARHETLASREDSRDLPKIHRFGTLGVPEDEMGYVGMIALPLEEGAGNANVFVQYVMPRNDRDSLFPPPFVRARTERALVERHFPDLVDARSPAHELAWLLLDHRGDLVSTGRTALAVDDLAREIEVRNPGYGLDSFRVVRRLRSIFDAPGLDVSSEPVNVAFLWLDAASTEARAGTAVPHAGRYALDATIYRNGEKVSTTPLNLVFGAAGRVGVPGQLRVDLSSKDIGGAKVISNIGMRVQSQDATAEYAERWIGIATASVQLEQGKPWRMGPSLDNPATATDEGGWLIEVTLKTGT